MEAIIIPKIELANLIRDSNKLYCLECGGVDNWEWYDESLNSDEFYNKMKDMSNDDLLDFYGCKTIEI